MSVLHGVTEVYLLQVWHIRQDFLSKVIARGETPSVSMELNRLDFLKDNVGTEALKTSDCVIIKKSFSVVGYF